MTRLWQHPDLPFCCPLFGDSSREAVSHRATWLSHCCHCTVHTQVAGVYTAPGRPSAKPPAPICFLAIWEVSGQLWPVSCGGSQGRHWEGLESISPNSSCHSQAVQALEGRLSPLAASNLEVLKCSLNPSACVLGSKGPRVPSSCHMPLDRLTHLSDLHLPILSFNNIQGALLRVQDLGAHMCTDQ